MKHFALLLFVMYAGNVLTASTTTATTVSDSIKAKELKISELKSDDLKIGQVFQVKNLLFAPDASNLKKGSAEVIDEVHTFLVNNPNITIEIGGHTNNVPPDMYCDELSDSRATTVAEYLFQKGIKGSRVTTRGYGKRSPIASNNTAEGRSTNQRVEIKILNI